MRGDAVGIGLAEVGGAVVGIGIVVVLCEEELADGGEAHERRRSATKSVAPRRAARWDHLSSVGVF